MKKKISVFIILLLNVCMLAACAPQNAKPEQTDSSSVTKDTMISGTSTEQVQKELDASLFVDAIVEKPNATAIVPYDMEWYSIPVENLTKLLIENNGDSVLESNFYENEEFKTITTLIKTGEGNSLNVSYGGFFFESTRGSAYKEILDFGGKLNGEGQGSSETLLFSSVAGAQEKIDNILIALGIADNFKPVYKVLAFEHATLEAEQNRLIEEDVAYKDFLDMGKINPIEQWSEDDDIYYIQFSFTLNDIPFLDKTFTFLDERTMQEFTGEGIISARGFESLYVNGIPRILTAKNTEQILSLDSLFEQIKLKYNDIILTSPVTITNIRLVYFPVSNIQNQTKAVLKPVWEVTIRFMAEEREKEWQIIQRLYWDAVTGEEIR